jgi:hypothetical protein
MLYNKHVTHVKSHPLTSAIHRQLAQDTHYLNKLQAAQRYA